MRVGLRAAVFSAAIAMLVTPIGCSHQKQKSSDGRQNVPQTALRPPVATGAPTTAPTQPNLNVCNFPTPTPPTSANVDDETEESHASPYILLYSTNAPSGYQPNELVQPDAGNTYVVVYVIVTNCGYESVPVNPLYCHVYIDGVKYSPGFVPVTKQLPCVELSNGASVDGYVGFEVPIGDKPVQFGFKPEVCGEPFRVVLDPRP